MRFQSTPTITGRRILRKRQEAIDGRKFQSTPTITGRRIRQGEMGMELVMEVSIHAHHYW